MSIPVANADVINSFWPIWYQAFSGGIHVSSSVEQKRKERRAKTKPIQPPTGSIPTIETAASLETAVTLSSFVIAFMIGLYVLITLAWGWLTVMLLMSLPERLEGSVMLLDSIWIGLSAVVVLVLLFLIKPLLPLRRKKSKPIEVTQEDQPELFAYIRSLAKCIDAPEPERVLIDIHANASASFAGGISPTSGPLTLTLGLPLIGGMTLRQLAGVIAHELGHFSQGSMVKKNILTGFVSGWLTEVALGEDLFDHYIDRLATTCPSVFRFVFKLIRLVTNAIRRVFYVVMVVGHMVTRMTARQLEYDADQYMVHTIGSEHFADTMYETTVLGYASQQAIDDAGRFYRDRRLPNNLPAMVIARARRMDDKTRRKLIRGEDLGHAEAFSTHPLTSKRIKAAEVLKSPGLVQDDRPAHELIHNFDQLCQNASEALYKEIIGKDYDPKHLTDSSRLIVELEATDRARQAAMRLCQSELLLVSPQFPSYRKLKMPQSPNDALAEIRKLRERAKQNNNKSFKLLREFNDAQDKLMQMRQAHVATQAGFEITSYVEFGLDAGDHAGLSQAVRDRLDQFEKLEDRVRENNSELIRRMELDFALLKHPKVTERIGEDKADQMWREIEKLVPAGQTLAEARDSYENMRVHANTLAMGMHLVINGVVSAQLIQRIQQSCKDTVDDIKDMLRILQGAPYPFLHGDGGVSIAHAICEKPPNEDSAEDIFFVAEDLAGRFVELRERIIGRLCHHAERVEKVMGLKPLPAIDESDELDELLDKANATLAASDEPGLGGLVASLLTQGVMGVAVLGLSGLGVFALLPGSFSGEPSEKVAAVSQHDDDNENRRPIRPATINRTIPDRATEIRNTPSPTTTRPPISTNTPEPESELEADVLLRMMRDRSSRDRRVAMEKLDEMGATLTSPQRDQMSAAAVDILLGNSFSPDRTLALNLLDEHVPDKGMAQLSRSKLRMQGRIDAQLINHIGSIGTREAADLLALIARNYSNKTYVSQAYERYGVSKYAEDALLKQWQQRGGLNDFSSRAMAELLAQFATKKSTDVFVQMLNSRDSSLQRIAEQTIARINPRMNDAAARFLRLLQQSPSDSQIRSELYKLAQSKPAKDDDRKPAVCRAIVRWSDQSSRRVDSTLLGALTNWGDASAVPIYIEFLNNEKSSQRDVPTAIQLAAAQTDDVHAHDVADAISNWFYLESNAVAAGLIQLGAPGEGPAIKHLKSKHTNVRVGCIKVLGEVGSQAGLKALQSMGSDPDPSVRERARQTYYALLEKIKKQHGQ